MNTQIYVLTLVDKREFAGQIDNIASHVFSSHEQAMGRLRDAILEEIKNGADISEAKYIEGVDFPDNESSFTPEELAEYVVENNAEHWLFIILKQVTNSEVSGAIELIELPLAEILPDNLHVCHARSYDGDDDDIYLSIGTEEECCDKTVSHIEERLKADDEYSEGDEYVTTHYCVPLKDKIAQNSI